LASSCEFITNQEMPKRLFVGTVRQLSDARLVAFRSNDSIACRQSLPHEGGGVPPSPLRLCWTGKAIGTPGGIGIKHAASVAWQPVANP